jgi:hypothetical protein
MFFLPFSLSLSLFIWGVEKPHFPQFLGVTLSTPQQSLSSLSPKPPNPIKTDIILVAESSHDLSKNLGLEISWKNSESQFLLNKKDGRV